MTAPIVFIDTETSGVHPDRRVWEVAMIRRDFDNRETHPGYGERVMVLQVRDVDLSNADPFGLKVGGFYDRHPLYRPKPAPGNLDEALARTPEDARAAADAVPRLLAEESVAGLVEKWTRGADLVACNPGFDTESLDGMLRRHQLIPAWHYHPIDVASMAVGYLAARPRHADAPAPLSPRPWKSDALAAACGVEPPSEEERHTALGDARWVARWFDAMTGGVS